MNLETKIIIYKFTPQVFTLTREVPPKSFCLTFRGHFLFYILPIPTIQKAFRQSPSPKKQILQGYTNVSASQYALPYQSGHCV